MSSWRNARIRPRRLRWTGGSAVAVVLAVSGVGAVAASAGGRGGLGSASSGCYPKGATTIAQDKTGRFFDVFPVSNAFAKRWYVCAFKQGTPRSIGFNNPDGGMPYRPSAKVSGRYLGFFNQGPPAPEACVWVFDMVTGHRLFAGACESQFSGRIGPGLVLRPDGSVAWVNSTRSSSGQTIWYVNRHDSTGTAVVDSGPGIDRHSLAAGGSWLYWTNAGSPRSAPFH